MINKMSKKSIPMQNSRNRKLIFLGIDPGISSIGYGVIKSTGGHLRMLDAGILEINSKNNKNQHYRKIARALSKLIKKWKPSTIGIETILFYKNARTAMTVAETIGVLKFVAEEMGIEIREFSPSQIKLSVTGCGKAPKSQILKMVAAILGLNSPPNSHHAADALAIALTAERYERFNFVPLWKRGTGQS